MPIKVPILLPRCLSADVETAGDLGPRNAEGAEFGDEFGPKLFEIAHALGEATEVVDERSDSSFLRRRQILILFGLVQFAGEGWRDGHGVNRS